MSLSRSPFMQSRTSGGTGPLVLADAGFAPGNVFFVQSTHSNAGDSAGHGQTPDAPFSTIDYAVGQCTAGQGDLVLVLPGHVEVVTAAGGLDLDVAGIRIVGLGEGDLRPRVNFTTADTADCDVDADDITVEGLVFRCSIDGQDIMLDVNADDFTLRNCRFEEGSSAQPDVVIDIDGGGANACDRVHIERCQFFFPSAGPTHCIKVTNAHDDLEVTDCHFHADCSTAVIGSGAAFTNALIARNVLSSLNADEPAIELTAAATGMLVDNRLYSDALATILDPGSLKCVGNRAVRAIDQADFPVPYSGQHWLGYHVAKATADVFTGSAVTLFNIVGGRVLVTLILGEVTTVIGAGANNFKLQSNPTTGTTTDLCGNLDIDADEVGTLYTLAGAPGTALQRGESGNVANMTANGVVVPVGAIEALSAGNVSGSMKFDLFYIPLDAGAHVTAG
jgi:hypothetical protein